MPDRRTVCGLASARIILGCESIREKHCQFSPVNLAEKQTVVKSNCLDIVSRDQTPPICSSLYCSEDLTHCCFRDEIDLRKPNNKYTGVSYSSPAFAIHRELLPLDSIEVTIRARQLTMKHGQIVLIGHTSCVEP